MTKTEYLENLRLYLRYKLSENEIDDIIADMEEFFDDGKAEGKNDSEIISDLGSAKNAAAEIIRERGINGPFALSYTLKYLLPSALGLLLCIIFLNLIKNNDIIPMAAIAVPPLIWLISEQRNFFRSMSYYPTDKAALAGSAILLCASIHFQRCPELLINGALHASSSAVITAVLIVGAMAAFIVSAAKSSCKLTCIIPAAACIPAITAAWETGRVFAHPILVDPQVFPRWAGAICIQFINVMLICSIITVAWAVFKRNAFSPAMLFSGVFQCVSIVILKNGLEWLDPEDPAFNWKFGNEMYMLAAVITFMAVLILTAVIRKTAAKRSVN